VQVCRRTGCPQHHVAHDFFGLMQLVNAIEDAKVGYPSLCAVYANFVLAGRIAD
jgi:hypothetical protein